MFAHVRLLLGKPQILTYKVPASWDYTKRVGTLVSVPLGKRTVYGIITQFVDKFTPAQEYTLKELIAPYAARDVLYEQFITDLCNYYIVDPLYIFTRLQQFIAQKTENSTPQITAHVSTQITQKTLTAAQQEIINALYQPIAQARFFPAVLHGVTGSGKTEIYIHALNQATATGKSALFLVPEVTLALQFEDILKARCTAPVYSFHSATTVSQKKELWRKINTAEPIIIIGIHLPIISPIAQLGLIIVDEEHETGYQEKKHPAINSRDAAIMRAHRYNIPIILGSATPSLNTLYNINYKKWHHFTLTERFKGAFAKNSVVSLEKIDSNNKRSNFWISKTLQQKITERLALKEQVILFLNRRGHSFFVQCSTCTKIISCKRCSVSLTVHDNGTLRCHYCEYSLKYPTQCPHCTAPARKFITKGIGTQQLAKIITELFPSARIGRADLDVTSKKTTWKETLEKFTAGEIDILVGTQTITKGYHFPKVTLVGVIWADLAFNIPRYNATECAIQQLIQVAGRAGRESPEAEVIIQTINNNPALEFCSEQKYLEFCSQELELRKTLQYPPYARLIAITLTHSQENIVEQESIIYAQKLFALKDICTVLGPTVPPIYKIKNKQYRVIYIKTTHLARVIACIREINKLAFKSRIMCTHNPV